jgi:hypothetical protein
MIYSLDFTAFLMATLTTSLIIIIYELFKHRKMTCGLARDIYDANLPKCPFKRLSCLELTIDEKVIGFHQGEERRKRLERDFNTNGAFNHICNCQSCQEYYQEKLKSTQQTVDEHQPEDENDQFIF